MVHAAIGTLLDEALGETKIDQLAMTLIVDHDMLRLQVAVDDHIGVQVFKRAKHLCRIELHIVLDSELVRLDPAEDITARNKVHLDVDGLLIVKCIERFHNEVIVVFRFTQEHQDLLFPGDMPGMIDGLDMLLLEYFESILIFTALFDHSHDNAKGSCADYAHYLEVVNTCDPSSNISRRAPMER